MTKELINIDKREVLNRISEARCYILNRYPFFGVILLNLKVCLAYCETAATDMKRIIFDPEFVMRISQEELVFVMLHEVMHCVFAHCVRGEGKNDLIYNIAADIVVNSCILDTMGQKSFAVDGEEVMHKTPGGIEGKKYSAEEVYTMLLKQSKRSENKREGSQNSLDKHDLWEMSKGDRELAGDWEQRISEASKCCSLEELPLAVRNILEELNQRGKINWRRELMDFIQLVVDNYDYSFSKPDKRYSSGEIIMPTFQEVYDETVKDIWFLADDSGSISDELLKEFFNEIKNVTRQFDKIRCKLSFFSTMVTKPIEFETMDDLKKVRPVSGGGTSFNSIFKYLDNYMMDEPPVAIVILTDGLSDWPKEESAHEIPVLWVIEGQKIKAPWGRTINI